MSHEIESMMYMGQTPWHGLGNRLEEAPTSEQAIAAAGLNWRVETRQLVADGPEPLPVNCAVATVRATDNTVLGVVGTHYTPLQNEEAFAFFDPFIKDGQAIYHTAGSLRGGARVWVLAKLNREPSVIAGDDAVEKFILLSNAHDGTMAVRVGFTPIRVVCANTLAMAHSNSASSLIRVRHSSNVAEDVEALREAMNLANAEFEATAEQFRALARREIDSRDLEAYVRLVFKRNRRVDESTAEETPIEDDDTSGKRIIPRVVELFERGRGNDAPNVRGTMWAAYNAVTEYLSYGRGKAAEARLNSLWFGESAQINKRALSTALRMAADLTDAEEDDGAQE